MLLLVAVLVAGCGPSCNAEVFVPLLDGQPIVSDTFDTEAECLDMLKQIEPQTPPFSALTCVAYGVSREKT